MSYSSIFFRSQIPNSSFGRLTIGISFSILELCSSYLVVVIKMVPNVTKGFIDGLGYTSDGENKTSVCFLLLSSTFA
jgi:hypothetical protein